MSRGWAVVMAGLTAAATATSTSALAEGTATAPTNARLYYQKAGPSECPEVETIRASVADRMGYDPFVDKAPILVLVAITIDPGATTRRARISVIDDTGTEYGQREIASSEPTCDDLASTVALVISVAIPVATERELEARRTAQLEALKKASYVPLGTVAAEPPRSAPPAPDALAWGLEVGGRASFGAVPGVAPGLMLGGGLRRRSISGAVELSVDVAQTQSVGSGHVDASLYRGGLVLCRHGGGFGLCALASGGGLHARGHGFTQDSSSTSPYLGIGGRMQYEVMLPRGFAAIVHVDAESALVSASLSVTGDTSWEWVAPSAAVAGGLALRSTFQ